MRGSPRRGERLPVEVLVIDSRAEGPDLRPLIEELPSRIGVPTKAVPATARRALADVLITA